ncbi:hypothetical protein NP493_70g00011 [Ridgeia piscesae]|uniref:Uncharacterized protein n=1 Tax=Ridgeia piscesae TaxID=27915 RepID=A0AAD9UID5_RIDPI|nr:hypothetical protein NP493_70g00011 [Ridgeia piscesae]
MSQHAQSCRVEIGMQAANRWHHQSNIVLPTYRFAVKVTENCIRGVANCPLTIAKLPPVTALVHHLKIFSFLDAQFSLVSPLSLMHYFNDPGSFLKQFVAEGLLILVEPRRCPAGLFHLGGLWLSFLKTCISGINFSPLVHHGRGASVHGGWRPCPLHHAAVGVWVVKWAGNWGRGAYPPSSIWILSVITDWGRGAYPPSCVWILPVVMDWGWGSYPSSSVWVFSLCRELDPVVLWRDVSHIILCH